MRAPAGRVFRVVTVKTVAIGNDLDDRQRLFSQNGTRELAPFNVFFGKYLGVRLRGLEHRVGPLFVRPHDRDPVRRPFVARLDHQRQIERSRQQGQRSAGQIE